MNQILLRLAQLPAPLRIGSFLLVLLLLWLPLVALLLPFGLNSTTNAIGLLLLYGCFVGLLQFWWQRVNQRSQLWQHYGLEWSRRTLQELLQGLGTGLLMLFSLFGLEAAWGWLVWQPPPPNFLGTVLAGLAVALSLGLAEELLFRGWLLDELQRDYAPAVALWSNSGLFALLHFLRPVEAIRQTWTQFLGLLLLGVALVLARRLKQGRLGLAIGLHAGLVWGYYAIDVANLITYTRVVPMWVTGVKDNPLAGLIGLLFLVGLILVLWRSLRQPQPSKRSLP